MAIIARDDHRDEFDTDEVIDGQPLPECVERLFAGVYYDHAYVSLAKLVAYEISSLSNSLNWMRESQRQSIERLKAYNDVYYLARTQLKDYYRRSHVRFGRFGTEEATRTMHEAPIVVRLMARSLHVPIMFNS